MADDANIYKLVGPVLLKQDTAEAKSTVDGRLNYIEQEMFVPRSIRPSKEVLILPSKRIEKQIADYQQQSEDKKMEVDCLCASTSRKPI